MKLDWNGLLTASVAFRDRNAGRESNRGKSTEEARGPRRGGYRGEFARFR